MTTSHPGITSRHSGEIPWGRQEGEQISVTEIPTLPAVLCDFPAREITGLGSGTGREWGQTSLRADGQTDRHPWGLMDRQTDIPSPSNSWFIHGDAPSHPLRLQPPGKLQAMGRGSAPTPGVGWCCPPNFVLWVLPEVFLQPLQALGARLKAVEAVLPFPVRFWGFFSWDYRGCLLSQPLSVLPQLSQAGREV